MTTLPFRKMHAQGDDFVLVDARAAPDPTSPALVRRLSDRHRGIGFNQFAVLLPCDDAAARLVFWNADGTRLAACGSATRGAALLVMREHGADALTLRTDRGLLACGRMPDGLIAVDMGPPLLGWRDVPLACEADTLALPMEGAPAACSMGNPHATFFVDDAEAVDVARRGPPVERHPLFPERTNVHFVEVLDRGRIRLRIWERGGGVLAMSGSCCCAAAVNGIRRGLLDEEVEVVCDSGPVRVRWSGKGGVALIGPIEEVFSGVLDAAALA